MADAVLGIVPLFQLLEARIIFCAVISGWPVCESKIRIVCVMPCDPGLRDMIANPAYRLPKSSLRARPIPSMPEPRPDKGKRDAGTRLPRRWKWRRPEC